MLLKLDEDDMKRYNLRSEKHGPVGVWRLGSTTASRILRPRRVQAAQQTPLAVSTIIYNCKAIRSLAMKHLESSN